MEKREGYTYIGPTSGGRVEDYYIDADGNQVVVNDRGKELRWPQVRGEEDPRRTAGMAATASTLARLCEAINAKDAAAQQSN